MTPLATMDKLPETDDEVKASIARTYGVEPGKFLTADSPPVQFAANSLWIFYQCNRGPVEQGGRGLSVPDAYKQALLQYLKAIMPEDAARAGGV